MRNDRARELFEAMSQRGPGSRRMRGKVLVQTRCDRGHLLGEVYETHEGPLYVSFGDAPWSGAALAIMKAHAKAHDPTGSAEFRDQLRGLSGPAPDLVLEVEPPDYLDWAYPAPNVLPGLCRCGKQRIPRADLIREVQAYPPRRTFIAISERSASLGDVTE